jgi:glycosyltransferase involved in cell wall biosynthesis
LIHNGLSFAKAVHSRSARERVRGELGLDRNTLAIGTASALAPIKRIDHIIRAVVALAREGLNVRGFIAGQPFFEGEAELLRLRQLVRDLDAEELISFLGWVEPVEPLLHAWDVCVSTSQYESFGMTVLEAMAAGCPVVAYAVGALPEVIDDAGELVKDGDIDGLLNALRRVADAQRRGVLADRGRSRAKSFDIRESVAVLAREYRDVLRRVPDPSRRENALADHGASA